jgi:fumarate reductase flavoprotein subunit
MLLSSGFIWRYREWERFRYECPGGNPSLQRVIFDRLDSDIVWLESLGATVLSRDTGNELTTGVCFDTRSLTQTLVSQAGNVQLGRKLDASNATTPLVLATGGFQANPDLVSRYITPYAADLVLRAAPYSRGDGISLGLAAGGKLTAGMDEFYGRNLPALPTEIPTTNFVDLAQVYATHATVENALGQHFAPSTWSEIDVVQWTARQPGARAWYTVAAHDLSRRVRGRSVREIIESAARAGAPVQTERTHTTVEVVAGITTTLGGLVVDTNGWVADSVYAAGMDAGGISTGGYSSGLATALVLGRRVCDAALGIA